jgi:hypothetical protein
MKWSKWYLIFLSFGAEWVSCFFIITGYVDNTGQSGKKVSIDIDQVNVSCSKISLSILKTTGVFVFNQCFIVSGTLVAWLVSD